MRDLEIEELGHVYGAGICALVPPPTPKHDHHGSKSKSKRHHGSKSKSKRHHGSKSKSKGC